MQEKLLKSLIEDLAGQESGPIVDLLFNKKDVNEFLIAKKMKLTINQIRNILYKLSADGLVSFIRKKDNRKGWYIYFWTLNTEKCLLKLESSILEKISLLKSQLLDRQQKRFYICNSCGIEVSEEQALENDFSCSECAEVYSLASNDVQIKEITNKIKSKERDLNLIQIELDSVKQKIAKKKALIEKKIKEKKSKDRKEKMLKKKKQSTKKIKTPSKKSNTQLKKKTKK
jgi:transcription initiation factor TFIIE subunit alpha